MCMGSCLISVDWLESMAVKKKKRKLGGLEGAGLVGQLAECVFQAVFPCLHTGKYNVCNYCSAVDLKK